MLEVKLWRFSLPGVEDVLYLYSLRTDEKYLRKAFRDQDHGDIDYETYVKLYSEGIIERITSLDQVPSGKPGDTTIYRFGQRGWCPYPSWELDPNEFGLTIQEFFDLPERYR